MNYLGNLIKTARKESKLTQTQLAELSGITQTHLSQIEAGKKIPTLETINDIAKAMNKQLKIEIVWK